MRFFLYLLLGITVVSCNSSNSSNAVISDSLSHQIKDGDTLQTIINSDINKKPVIDTIFLDFVFGMSKKQVISHFNDLVKKGKLILNSSDDAYEYPMTFDITKANAAIAPEYYNGKLYKLSLIMKPADDVSQDELVYLQASIAYMKKYSGYDMYREPDLIESGKFNYHFIKNNLHIYLHRNIDGPMVEYINSPVQKMVDADSTKVKTQKADQTNKDI